MDYILSIDDTDNLESPGTGEHLENIIELLKKDKLCECTRVTRHQLFFSPLIKYTSHNSSMSTIVSTNLLPKTIFDIARSYLIENAAEGSDPGVCLFCKDTLSDKQKQKLKQYGQKAKTQIVQKKEAFDLALQTGALLKELGGEGIGVIGALAGAALRLDGNDGRYKGKFDIGVNGDNMRACDILSHPFIDKIMTKDGVRISGETEIFIVDKIKTINKDNKSVLLIKKKQTSKGEIYINLNRSELKEY